MAWRAPSERVSRARIVARMPSRAPSLTIDGEAMLSPGSPVRPTCEGYDDDLPRRNADQRAAGRADAHGSRPPRSDRGAGDERLRRARAAQDDPRDERDGPAPAAAL